MDLLKRFTFLIIVFLGLFACEENKWEVDLSENELDLEWQRFELDLFDPQKSTLDINRMAELEELYPQLLPLYSKAIMRFGDLADSTTWATFRQFVLDESILELVEAVRNEFPPNDLQSELEQLEYGFLRFQYHFPEAAVPKVKSMISAFTYSTAVDDSLLVIGLDNYLGSEFKLYPQAGIPEYKFSHFSREFIVSDAMKSWLLTEFPSEAAQNLLEQMVYQGKIIYLLNAFLPEIEKHLFFNYWPEELKWCEENSSEIWAHFLEFELFFTTENHKIIKYMGDAPFIPGFPEGSPGRVGQWLGFEIVKKYMERKSNLNLQDLMKMEDANRILRESKYKPN